MSAAMFDPRRNEYGDALLDIRLTGKDRDARESRHGRRRCRNHFAEPDDRFAVRRKARARGIRGIAIKAPHHANTAVEGAQHFALADPAGTCEPLEHRQNRHAVKVQGNGETRRQHARNVFVKPPPVMWASALTALVSRIAARTDRT